MRQPLEPLLAEFERLLSGHLRPGAKVVFDVEKGLQVWADAAQLHQVLLNLVTNSMQAMPKGGVIVVRAHARHGGVAFEVIDTGVGIAEENLEKLFDPFFSTRADGHGIGLAVVQQLVTQHGGEVSVSSTVGDGTTLTVWWPSEVPA
jgi:two-component system sensor histidine kinase AtoS